MHQPIEPTVGRVVLYVLPGQSPRRGEIRPAIVVRVNGDGAVNLHVLTDGPNDRGSRTLTGPSGEHVAVPYVEPEWVGSAPYDQPAEGARPMPGTWHWMPYQLQMAKG